MPLYKTLLLVHMVAAFIWVGSNIGFSILSWRLKQARDTAAIAGFIRSVEWMGLRVFMPISLVVVAFGAWLVTQGNWGFDSLWVMLALAGFVLTFLTGILFLAPTSKKLSAVLADKGHTSSEFTALSDRLMMVSRVDTFVLVLVVVDMITKPSL